MPNPLEDDGRRRQCRQHGSPRHQRGADAGSFALLIDPHAKGSDIDVKVRFKIVSGDVSPAVGLAIGVRTATTYDVVPLQPQDHDLSLIYIAGAVHATVQAPLIPTVSPDPATNGRP